jgi:4-amino-4-deoxy-L-arabinose transferase-like glycosyltransferase
LDKFSGYRLAPALFFAVLVTVMYMWMSELFGRATGLFSAFALIVTPNLFGFAHLAVTDMPLASMWFLTAFCFWKGIKNWQWSVVFGVVWGLALSTKFPALLIPIPLFLWAHLFYRQSYANNVFAIVFLAPVVMTASQPYLWHQSLVRILEFLYEGVSRGYRLETSFPVLFYNKLYMTKTLPWYYALFMVAVTTPEVILALALLGTIAILWRHSQRETLMLFLANALFIFFIGLMPGAVLHDGVRQLLSVFPFIAALAGGGFSSIARWSLEMVQRSKWLQHIQLLRVKTVVVLFVLLLFSPALDLYLSHPFQLSFYNHLVGGIRGAYERGLEITYFMEAFTPSFLKSLNEKLPPNSTMNASFANFMFIYYQEEGRLRRDIKITDVAPFNYYVLLNRRNLLPARDRRLTDGTTQPYLSEQLAGVPLVAVFEVKKLEH